MLVKSTDNPVSPTISIVIATYNRSNVLSLAIQTVLWQTFFDWELIVVGDACTDDTAEVVAAFQDSRIRFVNLARNCGEQSGPNNYGVAKARGKYVAFLNHDDLWLPDHLATLAAHIEKTSADLVFSLIDVIQEDGKNRLSWTRCEERYDPFYFIAASSWLFRRSLFDTVGPWAFFAQCYNVPSQQWLFRAHRLGSRLSPVAVMTVVAIQSGRRQGVYRKRESRENHFYFERLRSERDFREQELTRALVNPSPFMLKGWRLRDFLLWGLMNMAGRAALALNLHPQAVRNFLHHPGRGGFIRYLRRKRGLGRALQ